MQNRENLFRGKRKDNGEWVEGYYAKFYSNRNAVPNHMIFAIDEQERKSQPYSIDPETVCLCTGKEYMDSVIAYEGDIFESQVSGDLMILRFGTYQAYCPVDRDYMDSVGFYAECKGYPDMPIGNLHDYALKMGNIFDDPELLKGGRS